MKMHVLDREQRERCEREYAGNSTLTTTLWHELAESQSELHLFIRNEALRLFPTSPLDRSRATRLVVEVLQTIAVAEFTSQTLAIDENH